jgi:hypothetical protein
LHGWSSLWAAVHSYLRQMVVLTFIYEPRISLVVTALSILDFAAIASFTTKASNYELVAATAAYAAVLVVFVSNGFWWKW